MSDSLKSRLRFDKPPTPETVAETVKHVAENLIELLEQLARDRAGGKDIDHRWIVREVEVSLEPLREDEEVSDE